MKTDRYANQILSFIIKEIEEVENPYNQCETCDHKEVDDYGYLCDITCGGHGAHCVFEKARGMFITKLKGER